MKLPIYAIVGDRPVKAVETKEGGMDVLAFDWKTGEFVREMDYLDTICMPGSKDVDFVSEDEFNNRVRELKAKI